MTKTSVRIQTTDHEGSDFPEASRYPEFVATEVAHILAGQGIAADVECDGGYPLTRVFGIDNPVLNDEIKEAVKTELWDAFCTHGYKAYSAA